MDIFLFGVDNVDFVGVIKVYIVEVNVSNVIEVVVADVI